MTTTPEEPIADPTEFPDSGPDLDPVEEAGPEDSVGGSPPYNPFAPGEPFSPGSNPRDHPQSQASI